MKRNFEILSDIPLFTGIMPQEMGGLLVCLSARTRSYKKGESIFIAGDTATAIGVILAGDVQVVKEDFAGRRAILAKLPAGELFGETFACAKAEKLPVSVFATADSEILLINYRKILTTCPAACVFHRKLIENMLGILAEKNLSLGRKIETLSRRTTREKLLSYLLDQAEAAGKRSFTIPFNRQELADYLCIDRSAMSGALGKLRAEGVLDFHKNRFTLLDVE